MVLFEFWLCHFLIKWSWACWFLAISFSSLKWEKSQHLQTVERIEWDNVCPVPKTGCVKRRYKINVNFLSSFPRLKTSLKECRHVCFKKKICILSQIGKKSAWNGNELNLWMWSFRELKWNTLFSEASAINRKKGKMHDYSAHVFLVPIFASLLTIIKY